MDLVGIVLAEMDLVGIILAGIILYRCLSRWNGSSRDNISAMCRFMKTYNILLGIWPVMRSKTSQVRS